MASSSLRHAVWLTPIVLACCMAPAGKPAASAEKSAPPIAAAGPDSAVATPEPEVDVSSSPPPEAAPTIAPAPPAPPAPKGPLFLGRFDAANATGPRFSWSGSAIVVRFTGPSLAVTLEDNGWNWYEVEVDGEKRAPLAMRHGVVTYSIASGLAAGEHVARIARRNEAHGGVTRLVGFEVAEGHEILSPPPRPTRRLEFVGDSITCGFGTAGDHPCPFEYRTENHELTYAALAAKELGAEGHTVCWSGWGMVRGADGSFGANLPAVYGRAFHKPTSPAWDTSSFQPHAVVIALGTNDFGQGDPGDLYTNAYSAFLARLRAAYPDAWLVATTSPMLYAGQKAWQRELVERALARRRAAGDERVTVVDFASQTFEGMGCGGHPGKKTHAKMAERLVPVLREKLGWVDAAP